MIFMMFYELDIIYFFKPMKIKAILLIVFALAAHSQMLVEADLKNHYSNEGYFITVPSGFILDFE